MSRLVYLLAGRYDWVAVIGWVTWRFGMLPKSYKTSKQWISMLFAFYSYIMSMNKSYEGITAQFVQFTQVTYEKFKIQGDVIFCISNAFLGGKGLQIKLCCWTISLLTSFFTGKIKKLPTQTCFTYQDFQHLFGVRVNLNEFCIQGRNLNKQNKMSTEHLEGVILHYNNAYKIIFLIQNFYSLMGMVR